MIKPLNGNWVDLVIILIFVYYATVAWRYGFFYILADFISFLASFLISLRIYKFAASLLIANFNLPNSLAGALGFIVTSIILESVFGYLLVYLIGMLPEKIRTSNFNKLLGLVPALGEGLILIAFLLTVIVALPINLGLKQAVTQSKLGGFIVKETSGVERTVNKVFGGALDSALTY